MKEANPRDIAQEFLDRQGETTISGDVEATFRQCCIPCTIETMQGQVIATNETQLRAICASFVEVLAAQRLTHLVRGCLEASFKGDDTIWATYETRYVRDGKLLSEDPYVGFIILRRIAHHWKLSALHVADASTSPANTTMREWSAANKRD